MVRYRSLSIKRMFYLRKKIIRLSNNTNFYNGGSVELFYIMYLLIFFSMSLPSILNRYGEVKRGLKNSIVLLFRILEFRRRFY